MPQPEKIYDISPLISEDTAVYPGDVAYQRKIQCDLKKGDPFTLSSIQTTLHIGAHTDAPNHYSQNGEGMHARGLHHYMGACQVISVKLERGKRIFPKDFSSPISAERVLFKTLSFPDLHHWNSDYNSLSPELIDFLAEKGVVLVGIDTPSVDPDDSKKLESHQAIYRKNLAILEGITLKEVPDGLYTLIALPLKLKDADASPVRAVLMERSHNGF